MPAVFQPTYRARCERLAFPLRSQARERLADTPRGRTQIAELMALTTPLTTRAPAYIAAPFTYVSASRFSAGRYGVLYAAESIETCVRETTFHLTRFFANATVLAIEIRKTHLLLDVAASTIDIRHTPGTRAPAGVYHPNDYRRSQVFGERARTRAQSIIYDSVRRHSGTCYAIFDPTAIANIIEAGTVALVWDGTRFTEAHRITTL